MKLKSFLLFMAVFIWISLSFSQTWTSFNNENSGLASNQVYTIVVDANGTKWFGTDAGLVSFDGTTWKTLSSSDNLAGNVIHDIFFSTLAASEQLWLATDNGISVVTIEPDALKIDSPVRQDNSGLVSNIVTSIGVDRSNYEWFGTDVGLSSFNGSEWATFTTDDYLSDNNVVSIGIDQNNGWKYIATQGGGVSRIRTDSVDGMTSASPYDYDWSGLLSDNVYAVYVKENGHQWFGTDFGPALHESTETKGDWTVFTKEDNGIVDNFVQAIVEDQEGTVWIGTRGGISSYDGATWTNYTTVNGLAGDNVLDIAVDLDGSLWFATDNGVTHYAKAGVLVEQKKTHPKDFGLLQNYPNPFNPSTNIPFQLSFAARVQVEIFNMHGQKIRTLIDEKRGDGLATVQWDRLNMDGKPANTGVYIVYLTASSSENVFRDSRKILLVK